jgi:hypothetical protein
MAVIRIGDENTNATLEGDDTLLVYYSETASTATDVMRIGDMNTNIQVNDNGCINIEVVE